MTILNGQTSDADEVLDSMGQIFANLCIPIWNAQYIGFSSKISGTGTPTYNKAYFNTFSSDTATTSGLIHNPTNYYYFLPNPFVIIEADDATVAWTSNDCFIRKLSSGKWIIGSSDSSYEVRRAKIIKSLFYGTNGTDQLMLDFTNVTSVKTSYSDDVGKRGHFAKMSNAGGFTGTYTGTFANTSTNTNCSSWSKCYATNSIDELGTDTTADELNNPADCQLEANSTSEYYRWEIPSGTTLNTQSGNANPSGIDVVILCVGGISWASGGSGTKTNIDFSTTHSIPDFTAGTLSDIGTISIELQTTGSETTNDMIGNFNVYPTDAGLTYTYTASADGSNYVSTGNTQVARFTNTGTSLRYKLALTGSFSGTDNIVVSEGGLIYNLA